MREPAFGTVAIARMLGVSRVTIHHWIQSGRIRAYRTPGRHFRVTRSDLAAFFKKEDLPLPDVLRVKRKGQGIWIGGDGRLLRRALVAAGGGAEGRIAWAPTHVADPWAGLIRVGRLAPDLVILDPALDEAMVTALCASLEAECPTPPALYVLRPDGVGKDAGPRSPDVAPPGREAAGHRDRWKVFAGSPQVVPHRLVTIAQFARELASLADGR